MKKVTAIMYSPAEDEPCLLAVYAGRSRDNGIKYAIAELADDDDDYEVRLKRAKDADEEDRICYSVEERYRYGGEWEEWSNNDHIVYLQQTNLLPVLK